MSSVSPLGTPISSDLNQNIAKGPGPQSQVTHAQDKASSSGSLDLLKENEDDFGNNDYLKDLTLEYEKTEKRGPSINIKLFKVVQDLIWGRLS